MLAEKRIAHHALLSHRVHFNRSIESEHQRSIEASFDKSKIFNDSFNRSAGSGHFGDLRMNLAKQGLLSRRSLEESCLSGKGEESLTSYPLGMQCPPVPAALVTNREASQSQCSSFGETLGLTLLPCQFLAVHQLTVDCSIA